MTYRRFASLGFALLCSLVLACGGDDDGPSGGPDAGSAGVDGSTAPRDGGGGDGGTAGDDGGTPSEDGGPIPGMDAGTPPVDTCGDPGDECIACVIGNAPETEGDCTCIACPVNPATRSGCEARQAQYNRVCGDWGRRNPCPDVLCTEPPPVACVDGTCQVASTTTR